jgi:hypothetical protein
MQPPPPAYNPDAGEKPPVAQAVQAMPAQPAIVVTPGVVVLPPANSVRVTPFPASSVLCYCPLCTFRLSREPRRHSEASLRQNLAEGSHPPALLSSSSLPPPSGGREGRGHDVRGRRGWGGQQQSGRSLSRTPLFRIELSAASGCFAARGDPLD